MEGGAKGRPNPEEGKNPLLAALETIISGNREIGAQLEKFSHDQGRALSGLSVERERLRMEIAAIGRLPAELENKNREHREETQRILDEGLRKYQDIELGLSERDRGLVERAEASMKRYWKVPAGIAALSLLMAAVTTFSAIRFYKESVRGKEELRQELAGELKARGLILVDQKDWKNYGEKDRLIEAWEKNNPRSAKSLEDYIKGYEDFKKGKK